MAERAAAAHGGRAIPLFLSCSYELHVKNLPVIRTIFYCSDTTNGFRTAMGAASDAFPFRQLHATDSRWAQVFAPGAPPFKTRCHRPTSACLLASTATAAHPKAPTDRARPVPFWSSRAPRRAAPSRQVSHPPPPRFRPPTAARHGRGAHGGHGPGFVPRRRRPRQRARSPLRRLWGHPRRVWMWRRQLRQRRVAVV